MKICFISKNVYPLATDSGIAFAGGAEVQLLLLAREFRKRGCEISFVTDDFGQGEVRVVDDIKYYKVPFRYMGGNKLYLLIDWFILFKKLKKIDADFYLMKGPRFNLCPIAVFCKYDKKKSVFLTTTDYDCNISQLRSLDGYSRHLYYLGLKLVDAIVVQSEYQKKEVMRVFKKGAIVIRSIAQSANSLNIREKKPYVLWVGNDSKEIKRPHLFVELAKRLPNTGFKMIASPNGAGGYDSNLLEKVKQVSNLEFIGFVPFSKVNRYLQEASVFVNTSVREGFPNTFLQAWAYKTPVVSMAIDPDNVIQKYSLGFCSGSFENMVLDMKRLLESRDLQLEMGENGFRYVKREHNPEKILARYINLFEEAQRRELVTSNETK